MTEGTQGKPGTEGAAPSGPGSALKAKREALGYSVQDMADSLNLTVRIVNDLEAERWNRLPAAAFARGYLRAYAKLLGLDADALLAGYAGFGDEGTAAAPARPVRGVAPSRGLADLAARQPGTVISGAVVAAVCAVLVVLYLVWPDTGERAGVAPPKAQVPRITTAPARAAAVRPSVADSATPIENAIERDVAKDVEKRTEAEPAKVDAVPVPRDTAAAAEAETDEGVTFADVEDDGLGLAAAGDAQTVVSVADREPQSRLRRISPDGEDRVDFEFTEDCWVEVSDAGGRNFSDLARAGDTLVLVGQAPFRIRLGYGPGASIAFNGETIALAPHTRRSNVAFLVLDPAAPTYDE